MKLLLENGRKYLKEQQATEIQVYPNAEEPKVQNLVNLTKKVFLKLKKDILRDIQTTEYQDKIDKLILNYGRSPEEKEEILSSVKETINDFKLMICTDPEQCEGSPVWMRRDHMAACDSANKTIKINIFYDNEESTGKSKVYDFYQKFYHELTHTIDQALKSILKPEGQDVLPPGGLVSKKSNYISAHMDELKELQKMYKAAGGKMNDLLRPSKIHEYYARLASAKAFLRRINQPNNIEALFDPKNKDRLPVDAAQLIEPLKNIWNDPQIKEKIISIFQEVVYE